MSDENTNPNPNENIVPETPAEDTVVETPTPEALEEVSETTSDEATSTEESSVEESTPEEAAPEAVAPAAPRGPARTFGAPVAASAAPRGGRDDRRGGGGDRGGSSGGRRGGRDGGKGGFEPVKKDFEEVLLEVGRVTKVTSGGRQLRFRAAVVIGDRKGRVGFGLGKAQEVSIAVEKAVNSAKRHMITVPLTNGTIAHQVETKFKAVKIMIHPASEGTGIIAGGSTRRILELAGCQDILSKRHGGRNVITSAYATMNALKKLQKKAA